MFALENGRTIMPDPFHDDMSLYCVTPAGLFIVLGCAHAGLINIVEHAREVTGESRVYGIIGGAHLGPAPVEQQEATINYLKELDLQFLGANHCTGLAVISRMANVFGPRFKFSPAGSNFTIPRRIVSAGLFLNSVILRGVSHVVDFGPERGCQGDGVVGSLEYLPWAFFHDTKL